MAGQDHSPDTRPLTGTVVLDLSRMLPGAVLARQLIDLGARLIKVEDPAGGDPLRLVPPQVGGIGVAFAAFLRGAESVCLDLRADAASARRLARGADVVVESFRPGTLERWGLGPDRLHALNPRLVFCSLSGFGADGPWAQRAGHDLNIAAVSGLLSQLPGTAVPGIQIVDVAGGLLACSAILAALLARHRTGEGAILDQPLAAAPLPFLTWAWAEESAAEGGALGLLLGGRIPCYRRYACADGEEVAVGAIEPKFWTALVEALELPHLAGAWLDDGEEGRRAVEEVGRAFAAQPLAHWLRLAEELDLPVTPVNDLEAARRSPLYADRLTEEVPTSGGQALQAPGPWHPSLGRTPERPAPALGEHTEAVLAELGLDD